MTPSHTAPAQTAPAHTAPTAMALAEALAARLCHDVAGDAGTIAGMLDLAAGDDPTHDARDVARDAAARLLRRVRLTRAAWAGTADWEAGALPALAAALATDRLRVTLDTATLERGRDGDTGRLLLNVLLLGAETLGGRGELRVAALPAAGFHAELAPAANWPDEPADPADPRRLQAAFTVLLARSLGATLRPLGPVLTILPRA